MKKIGRYEIESEIGVGGMGVVYKAYDPKFESPAAIKTLSAELSADPEFRYRFFSEAKNTRRLRHPNIVDVYDLGEEEGIPYLVMELLEGEDLKNLISTEKTMTLERKLKIMQEVCCGMSFAHQLGTIHRDIKPGNIFITSTGQVKILDFGLAKAVSSHSITTKDQVMGTPNYMPPEQWKSSKVDQRADIFATGAVFYELLTYRKAFDGENMEQILYKILYSEPEDIESVNMALPIELSRIIHKALAKNINGRYQSISEMEKELDSFSHSLEQRKPGMQSEALSAVGRLKHLIEANKESFELSREEREDLAREFPSLFEVMSGEDESVTTWNPPKDYLSLFESCRQANFQYDRLKTLIEKRNQLLPLLRQAEDLAQNGQIHEAYEVLRDILHEDPAHPAAADLQEQLTFKLEQQRLAQQRALQVEELCRKAEAQFASGDLPGCLSLIEETLAIQPGLPAVLELQSRVQQILQEQAELEARRQQAQESLAAARQAAAQQDFKRAHHEVERARDLYPQSPDIADVLEEIGRSEQAYREEQDRRQKIAVLLQESQKLFESGKMDLAQVRIQEILALDSACTPALELKAEVKSKLQVLERVERLLQRAHSRFEAGEWTACLKLVDEVLKIQPESVEAIALQEEAQHRLREKASQAEKRRRVDEVLSAARKALTAQNFVQAHKEVANARSVLPDDPTIDQVLQEIHRAEAFEESRRKLTQILQDANDLAHEGEWEIAISRLNEILQIEPAHIAALKLKRDFEKQLEFRQRAEDLMRRAQAALSLNDLDGCQKSLDELLKLEPKNAAARELQDEVRRRKQEKAEQAQRRLRFGEALNLAGKALAEEDFERARRQLELAHSLEPESKELEALQQATDRAWSDFVARQEKKRMVVRLLQQAQVLLSEEEEQAALDQLNMLLALEPAHIEALRLRKEIDSRRQERSRQREERQERIAANYLRAKEAESTGDLQRAAEMARAVLSEERTHPDALQLLERIDQVDREAGARKKIADLLVSAQQAFIRQDYDGAGRYLEELLLLDAENRDARELLQKTRSNQEEKALKTRIAELLTKSRQALSRDDFEDAEIRAREILLLQAANAEAEELLQRIDEAAKKKKTQEAIGGLLAQCRQALGREDYEESARCAHEVLRLSPGHREAAALLRRAEKGIQQREHPSKRIPAWMPIAAAVVTIALGGYLIFRPAAPVDTGEIVITSSPADAEVFLDNGSTMFKGVIKDGKFPFSVPAGPYTLVTSKKGYVDKREKITLSKGKNPDMTISLERKLAALQVRTNPPVADVQIFLDGIDTGVKTGGDGTASIPRVEPGSRVIGVYREGYEEIREDRTILADSPNEIKLDLKRREYNPKLAYLRISVTPPDLPEATITIEGLNIRRSEKTKGGSVSLDELKPGTAKVLVAKEGYKEESKDIDMAPGRATVLPFKLLPKPAHLVLHTNPGVANARIKIDDVEKGKTDATGIFKLDVEPGNRKVSLESDSYEPAVDIYLFLPGKPCEINLKLKPLPNVSPGPTHAMLQIISEPDANLYIDGQPAGKIGANRMSDWLNIKPGTVRIKVTKPGYEDSEERQVKLTAGQPTSEQFVLRQVPGNLLFEVTPADAEVRIEGKTYKLSETRKLPLAPGEHDVLVQKPGYRTETRTVKIFSNSDLPLKVDLARESAKPDVNPLAVDHTEEFRNLNNWENPAAWKADGGLHAQGAGRILLLNKIYADFIARLSSIRLINGKAITFILRAKDRQNYYAVRIAGDAADVKSRGRVLFYVYKDGIPIEKDSRPLAPVEKRLRVLREAPFNISIEVKDRQITVKLSSPAIAEVELGRFVDTEGYSEGQIGFEITGDEIFEIQRLLVKPIQ